MHGIATAAGCQLVSMCDLAVASENATFALPGVNVGGLLLDAGGWRRNIGRKHAMELLLTGQLINAATAPRVGLVNRGDGRQAGRGDRQVRANHPGRSAAVIEAGKRTFYEQTNNRSRPPTPPRATR